MFLEKYNIGTYCHGNEEANRRDSIILADILGLKMEIPPEPEGLLKDEEIVTFGKTELKVLFVPGHSSGSLAFYCEKEGVVFTGDALFAGSIGRTDLSGGNYDMLIHSIKTKLFILPPATIVYPGHGESTTIEKEIKTNPYFN
jgi:glyoxylase-like metal-dependent hydrolase (beta-lactamase superfamily II)